MFRAETERAKPRWEIRGERINSDAGSTPDQETMASALTHLISTLRLWEWCHFPLGVIKLKHIQSLSAVFLSFFFYHYVFSLFPIIVTFFNFLSSFSFFLLCYNILCYDKYLLSSMCQRLQRIFSFSLPFSNAFPDTVG